LLGLIAHAVEKPYQFALVQRAEFTSLSVSWITMFLSQFIFSSENSSVSNQAVSMLVLGLNCLFVGVMLVLIGIKWSQFVHTARLRKIREQEEDKRYHEVLTKMGPLNKQTQTKSVGTSVGTFNLSSVPSPSILNVLQIMSPAASSPMQCESPNLLVTPSLSQTIQPLKSEVNVKPELNVKEAV
jgi:hypothetical protein